MKMYFVAKDRLSMKTYFLQQNILLCPLVCVGKKMLFDTRFHRPNSDMSYLEIHLLDSSVGVYDERQVIVCSANLYIYIYFSMRQVCQFDDSVTLSNNGHSSLL